LWGKVSPALRVRPLKMESPPLRGTPVAFTLLPSIGSPETVARYATAGAFVVVWIAALYIILTSGVLNSFAVSSLALLACATIGTEVFQHLAYGRRAVRVVVSAAGIETLSRRGQAWTLRWTDPRFHIWVNLGPGGKRSQTPAIIWVPMRFMPATTVDPGSFGVLVTRAKEERLEVRELSFRLSLLAGKLKAVRISRAGLIPPDSGRP